VSEFRTTVEYYQEWDGNWRLTAIRVSDGVEITAQYRRRPKAIRIANSCKKLRRMFKSYDEWEAKKAAHDFEVC
jgi:hypothetical protein